MEFEFQPNLRRMALHANALSYWYKDDIQSKFKKYLFSPAREGIKKYLIELIHEVVKKIDPEPLGCVLYCELVLVVKDIAYKSSEWFRTLRRHVILQDQSRWQIYDKFFRKIYWTHYGTINEVKILRDYWMQTPGIDLKKLYVMACIYCAEDLIKKLWGMMSLKRIRFSYKDLYKTTPLHIVAYWNKLRKNDLEGLKKDLITIYNIIMVEVYDPNYSIEANLLRSSISKGYVSAVKYFWTKISGEERNLLIARCFNQTLCLYRWYDKLNHEFYRKEKFTEIAMFLMNFTKEDSKREIFTDLESDLHLSFTKKSAHGLFLMSFFMLVRMWPWHELLPSFLKEVKNFINVEQYGTMMNAILYEMDCNSRFAIPVQHSISQTQLHQVWFSVPSSLRAAVSKDMNWELLLKTENLSGIKLILNDTHVSREKQNIIKVHYLNFVRFVKNGKDDLFFDIVNEIIIFKEWDKSIRENLKILYAFAFKGDIASADNVLNSYSDEEKIDIKGKMDHELICYYYILKEQFDAADEFLQWKFSETEKIKDFKARFLNTEFTWLHVKNLWEVSKENVNVAKFKADRFLLWLLETDRMLVSFKKELIRSKYAVDRTEYDDKRFIEDHYEMIVDFVDWCTPDTEIADKLKKTILTTYNLSIMLQNYMKHNRIEEAGRLLNWAFDSSDKRKDFMQKFLLEDEFGILAIKLYVGKYSNPGLFQPEESEGELTEKFTKFIDFFIKPYLNSFDQLKSKFENWEDESDRKYNKKQREDSSSDDDGNSEHTDEEEDYGFNAYCDIYNYKLFLYLLDFSV